MYHGSLYLKSSDEFAYYSRFENGRRRDVITLKLITFKLIKEKGKFKERREIRLRVLLRKKLSAVTEQFPHIRSPVALTLALNE